MGERVQVNLGAGQRPRIPGFVNVDIASGENIDYVGGIDKLPWFEDNSVDLLYSSHSFEYFDRIQALYVLREWIRVLKKGGVLRIAVPDFAKLIEVYEDTGVIENVLGPVYGIMPVNDLWETQHRTMYDERSLTRLLKEAGLKDIHRYDWRKTVHKGYDDHSQAYFPHMDKDHGKLVSLNLEATK